MTVAIKKALDEEGIEIPFPHTSIYAGSQSEPFRVELLRPEAAINKGDPDANQNG